MAITEPQQEEPRQLREAGRGEVESLSKVRNKRSPRRHGTLAIEREGVAVSDMDRCRSRGRGGQQQRKGERPEHGPQRLDFAVALFNRLAGILRQGSM
jgi:hypothetical protein